MHNEGSVNGVFAHFFRFVNRDRSFFPFHEQVRKSRIFSHSPQKSHIGHKISKIIDIISISIDKNHLNKYNWKRKKSKKLCQWCYVVHTNCTRQSQIFLVPHSISLSLVFFCCCCCCCRNCHASVFVCTNCGVGIAIDDSQHRVLPVPPNSTGKWYRCLLCSYWGCASQSGWWQWHDDQ